MTLSDILADLYDRLNLSTSPSTGTIRRLTRFINQTHREILTGPGMEKLRDSNGILTFDSVVGQKIYGLPQSVEQLRKLFDMTNQWTLKSEQMSWVRQTDPGLRAVGIPSVYVPVGIQAVAAQPSTACQPSITHTGSNTLTVEFDVIRTGGVRSTDTKTLAGSTTVSSTYTDVIEITRIILTAASTGTVTFTETGVGTLAVVEKGRTSSRYWGIQLWPTPSSVRTYTLDYTRLITDLSDDTDIPMLPEDFHFLLVEGALLKEYAKEDDRRQMAMQTYADGIRRLRSMVLYPQDYEWGFRKKQIGSNLGSWYPAGRW